MDGRAYDIFAGIHCKLDVVYSFCMRMEVDGVKGARGIVEWCPRFVHIALGFCIMVMIHNSVQYICMYVCT